MVVEYAVARAAREIKGFEGFEDGGFGVVRLQFVGLGSLWGGGGRGPFGVSIAFDSYWHCWRGSRVLFPVFVVWQC